MTSLRKLKRRLRVWQRYDARYPTAPLTQGGFERALTAFILEKERRDPTGWHGSDWFDDEGYPWPGAVTVTAFAEQGLL